MLLRGSNHTSLGILGHSREVYWWWDPIWHCLSERDTVESFMYDQWGGARGGFWHQRRISFSSYALRSYLSSDIKSSSSITIFFFMFACTLTWSILGKYIFGLSLRLALCIPSNNPTLIPPSVAKGCTQGTIHLSCFSSKPPSTLQVNRIPILTYLISSC